MKLQNNRTKPYIHTIKTIKELDDNPDLSYLKESKDPKDIERLKDYEKNYWWMVGIYAETTIIIPYVDAGYSQLVTIRTGGLWGLESDSTDEYFKEVRADQIEQLEDICKKLHVRIPHKELTFIED